MKKTDEEKIESWIKMSDAVIDIYLKITEFEASNTFDDEYKSLLYLLPTAIRIEQKNFNEIGLNSKNYKQLQIRFDISNEDISDITNGNSKKLANLRRHNYLTSIINFKYNGFYKQKETYGLVDLINNENEKTTIQREMFAENYHTELSVNFINMLERYINEVDDEDTRNYLIYLKYMTISTVPRYERDYILFGIKTLPIRDIHKVFPQTWGFSEEEIQYSVKENLKEDFLIEVNSLLQLNNFILPHYKRELYKELALNKARLISLNSKDFIEELKREIEKLMKQNDNFYAEINHLLKSMFDDALELIGNKPQKKVL